jgi:hypothetical protein
MSGRRRPARRRFRAALQWNRLALIGLEELARVQVQAIGDAHAVQGLQDLIDRTAESIGDVTILLRRQGGRPWPLAGLTRGAFWAAGCLVASFGAGISLALDRWVIECWLHACGWAARRIPADDGITARALEAVRDREAPRQRRRQGTAQRCNRGWRLAQ